MAICNWPNLLDALAANKAGHSALRQIDGKRGTHLIDTLAARLEQSQIRIRIRYRVSRESGMRVTSLQGPPINNLSS